MNECCEISLSGIDTTPSDNLDKIWQCDACKTLYKEKRDGPYTEFYHVEGRYCYCGGDWQPKIIQTKPFRPFYECPHCARQFTPQAITKSFEVKP